MTRRNSGPRPIKFTLRFYPGRDDDLIRWLDEIDGEYIGAKTRTMKEALRCGLGVGPLQATVAAPELDRSTELTASLAEIRQVVEVAVASALGRYQGEVAGPAVTTTAAEEDDETEGLLEAFKDSLVLGDD
jgi:hypothetical protein